MTTTSLPGVVQPHVITHFGSRWKNHPERSRERFAHFHGAVYCPVNEEILHRCSHEHPTLPEAETCAHQLVARHGPARLLHHSALRTPHSAIP